MSLPAPRILTWLLIFWKNCVPLTTNMFKEWKVQDIILKTTVTFTELTLHYESPTCCATESLNRTSDSHINFPATTTTLRNIVLCMSPLFETPQIIKKRLPVACQEVRRGAKIIAFFRCYTWRLRQNRVAATERNAKRGNNWATQRAVNCGVEWSTQPRACQGARGDVQPCLKDDTHTQ